MKKLHINYDANSHTDSDNDEGDGSPYSGYRSTYIDLTVHGLTRSSKESFGDSLDVDDKVYAGDEGWLVVVRYSTGSTFSKESGAYKFIAVFQRRAAAQTLADEIKKDYRESKNFKFLPKTKNPAYDVIYCSWKGYFERLEQVQVLGLGIS